MNEKKFKEKLVKFLTELGKPKKYEIGFVQPNVTVNDGLVILGLVATDVLGFTKSTNERRVRKVKGAQAWFKKMYEDGWKFAGNFEYEGLLNNGFVVMERELPNLTLKVIKEELDVMLRDDNFDYKLRVPEPIIEGIREVNPDKLQTVTFEKRGDLEKAVKKAREPKEGFSSEVNDFIIEAKDDMKTLEQIFFDETGKNAIWRGAETKGFKLWKESLD